MLHNAHTQNPRNSANTDTARLRLATRRPVADHCASISGSQLLIQRPRVSSSAAEFGSSVSGFPARTAFADGIGGFNAAPNVRCDYPGR